MSIISRLAQAAVFMALLVAVGLFGQAEPVGPAAAERVAINWMTSVAGPYAPSLALRDVSTEEVRGRAVFYVVSFEPSGFVIVAADDALPPVLAYSYETHYMREGRPRAFEVWAGQVKREVQAASRPMTSRPGGRSRFWKQFDVEPRVFGSLELFRVKALTGKSALPLLGTAWGQGEHYNGQYPARGRSDVPSGATAMGQILKYWGYPEMLDGAQAGDNLRSGTAYDWAGMPDSLSGENAEVARLLGHCGEALLSGVVEAYRDRFGYSRAVTYERRDNFPLDEAWYEVLRTELDNGRPVHYRLSEGGADVVVDGYQETDYFHVNWGSEGELNGYYHLGDGRRGTQSMAYRIIPSDRMPEPELREVVVPPSIALGTSIELFIEADNIGKTATEGRITVSFPGLNKIDDDQYVEAYSSSVRATVLEYPAGSNRIKHQRGYEVVPGHLAVEMVAPAWENLERKSLMVRVAPQRIGAFEILVRSTMGCNKANVGSPSGSQYRDQQGWEVRRYVVNVTPMASNHDRAAVPAALGPQVVPTALLATLPFNESFDAGPELPAFWTTQCEGEGVVNTWGARYSTDAGGSPWEATGYWQDINPGTTRLIVPVLNTLNRSALALSFKHYFSAYTSAGGVQLKIQSSTNGVTWTDELWLTTQTGSDIGPATINTYITHNLNSGVDIHRFCYDGRPERDELVGYR